MDRDTFVEHARRHLLNSEQDSDAILTSLPRSVPGSVLARALVAMGLLTRFQARRLLAGKSEQLLLGPYRILDRIGRGSTGPVFKAVHETTGQTVAIKVIHSSVLREGVEFDFRREVLAAAELHHPGIVAPYEAGVSRGRHFLAMEYIDGPSLHSLVQTAGPLQVSFACELMSQAAEVLQFAHEKGMVHRDIKPANLLIAGGPGLTSAGHSTSRPEHSSAAAPKPTVKIIDFGLARLRDPGSAALKGTVKVEPGTVWGTVDYIAPEQAEDVHAADIRSDLYSLGCTFYYALTGCAPFRGSALEKLAKHLFQEAPHVTAERPDVPASIGAIFGRLMSKDRAHRFQTPAELTRALAAEIATACPTPAPIPADSPLELQPGQQTGRDELENEDAAAAPARAGEPEPARQARRPLVDRSFQKDWRRWTELVAGLASGRRPKLSSHRFELLRERLLRRCDEGTAAATGTRAEFFDRLSGLVKPWLNRAALSGSGKDILQSLHQLCLQGEVGLRVIAASQAKDTGGKTILGSILAVFKRRRE